MDIPEAVLNNLVFKTISGSRSYGLNLPSSDEDFLGVFMPRLENIVGVENSINNHYRIKEIDQNYKVFHEFVHQIYDGSHFWIEPLFVRPSDIIILEPYFEPFIENRSLFLTQAMVSKSIRFMDGMNRRSKSVLATNADDEQKIKWQADRQKNAAHSVRVGYMILEMLDNLDLQVYRINDREHLLNIKNGEVSIEAAIEESIYLIAKIKEKSINSKLPEKADTKIINSLLVNNYISYWNDKKWI